MPFEVGGDPENIILEDVMPTDYYPTPSWGPTRGGFPRGFVWQDWQTGQETSHKSQVTR